MNRENQYSMPLLPTYIREIYSQLPFDMNLVSSDKKKVPVHYIIMAIYSKFLRKMLSTEKFKLGLEVNIQAEHNVLEKAVKFLYDRNVHIPREMENDIKKVFAELDVYDRKSIDETLKQQQLNDYDADLRVYEDFPQVGVEIHKESENRRLQWACQGKDCKVECITKLVEGQMMINKRKQVHSSACNQQWVRPSESKANRPSENDSDNDDSYNACVLMNGDPRALNQLKQEIAAEGKKMMPCKFPGCKGGMVMKFINGKIMAKEKHSQACVKKSQKMSA